MSIKQSTNQSMTDYDHNKGTVENRLLNTEKNTIINSTLNNNNLILTKSDNTTITTDLTDLKTVNHDLSLSGNGDDIPLKVEISSDSNNSLNLGNDGKLYVPATTSTNDWQLNGNSSGNATLGSTDSNLPLLANNVVTATLTDKAGFTLSESQQTNESINTLQIGTGTIKPDNRNLNVLGDNVEVNSNNRNTNIKGQDLSNFESNESCEFNITSGSDFTKNQYSSINGVKCSNYNNLVNSHFWGRDNHNFSGLENVDVFGRQNDNSNNNIVFNDEFYISNNGKRYFVFNKENGELTINNSTGNAGDVLTSQGAGNAPTWSAPNNTNSWNITGNAGTNPTINFVGTTDNQDLVFRTNNVEQLRLKTNGNLNITGYTNTSGENVLEWNDNRALAITDNNTFLGVNSGNIPNLASITNSNAIGNSALANSKGSSNNALGSNAGNSLDSGSNSIAIGNNALAGAVAPNLLTGNGNIAIGTSSMFQTVSSTMASNIAIGTSSLRQASGNTNIAIGPSAGISSTGNGNIWIGNNAGNGSTASNGLAIGTFIYGLANGNIGFGVTTPTSRVESNGSIATANTIITATTTLTVANHKVIINNGATNITITLPDALTCLGREYVISRYANSTGTITIQGTGTNQIQALAGTVGATTSISAHSGTGTGLNQIFTAVNVGGVGVWVRI